MLALRRLPMALKMLIPLAAAALCAPSLAGTQLPMSCQWQAGVHHLGDRVTLTASV